jgi:hypothetical protein
MQRSWFSPSSGKLSGWGPSLRTGFRPGMVGDEAQAEDPVASGDGPGIMETDGVGSTLGVGGDLFSPQYCSEHTRSPLACTSGFGDYVSKRGAA